MKRVRKCNISGCVNNTSPEKMPNVSYNELPADLRLSQIWEEILDPYLANRRNTTFAICSLHFEERCFKFDFCDRKRKLLIHGSIPTIFNGVNIARPRLRINDQESAELQHPLEIKCGREDVTEALPTDVQLSEDPITSKYVFSSVKIVKDNVNEDICRICFKSAAKNYHHLTHKHRTRGISYRQMLEYVCEDINLDFYPDPVICIDCYSLLLSAYDFKKTYSKTEKILTVYKSQKTSVNKPTKLFIVASRRGKKSELQINQTENVQETPSEVPEEHSSLPVDITRESVDSAVKPTEDDDEVGVTKEVNTLLQREKKLKLDRGDGPYLCDMCGRIFADKQVCCKHMKVHFVQKGIVENSSCTVSKSSYENVNPDVHMDTHRIRKQAYDVSALRTDIVYSCKVPSCTNAARRCTKNNKRFFKFPKDPEIRKEWKKFCGIPEDFEKCDNYRVCSDHFSAIDFPGVKGLSCFAIPH